MIQVLVISLAAFAAGAMNAIAGGGTFLVFPALTGFGHLSEKLANISSTLGIWPGSAASVVAARADFAHLPRRMLWAYGMLSLLGGGVGSLLLLCTSPAAFGLVIPWLLAFATAVFAASKPIARWAGRHQQEASSVEPSTAWTAFIGFVIFTLAIYGGYFGAGMGILMLAGLSFTGLSDIHQMNAMKVLLQTLVNGVACGIFVFGHPAWKFVVPMACCSAVSGFFGMAVGRRIPRENLRAIVLLCGLWLTIVYFVKNYGRFLSHG